MKLQAMNNEQLVALEHFKTSVKFFVSELKEAIKKHFNKLLKNGTITIKITNKELWIFVDREELEKAITYKFKKLSRTGLWGDYIFYYFDAETKTRLNNIDCLLTTEVVVLTITSQKLQKYKSIIKQHYVILWDLLKNFVINVKNDYLRMRGFVDKKIILKF